MPKPVISFHIALNNSVQDGPPTTEPGWTDFSSRLSRRFGIVKGLSSDLGRVETGDAVFALDNRDGALDPENIDSPYWNSVDNKLNVKPGRWVRLRADSTVLFMGTIDKFGEAAAHQFSEYVDLQCVDILEAVSRGDVPKDLNLEQARALNADSYFSFDELPNGNIEINNLIDGRASTLSDWTDTEFQRPLSRGGPASGKASKLNSPGRGLWLPTESPFVNYTWAGWIALDNEATDDPHILTHRRQGSADSIRVKINGPTGVIMVDYIDFPFSGQEYHILSDNNFTKQLSDGQPHFFCLALLNIPDFSTPLTPPQYLIQIDSRIAGGSLAAGPTFNELTYIEDLSLTDVMVMGKRCPGLAIDSFSTYDRALNPVEMDLLWQAGQGYAGETADARFRRLIAYSDVPATLVNASSSLTRMGALEAESKLVSQLDLTISTESGTVSTGNDGSINFGSRYQKFSPKFRLGDAPMAKSDDLTLSQGGILQTFRTLGAGLRATFYCEMDIDVPAHNHWGVPLTDNHLFVKLDDVLIFGVRPLDNRASSTPGYRVRGHNPLHYTEDVTSQGTTRISLRVVMASGFMTVSSRPQSGGAWTVEDTFAASSPGGLPNSDQVRIEMPDYPAEFGLSRMLLKFTETAGTGGTYIDLEPARDWTDETSPRFEDDTPTPNTWEVHRGALTEIHYSDINLRFDSLQSANKITVRDKNLGDKTVEDQASIDEFGVLPLEVQTLFEETDAGLVQRDELADFLLEARKTMRQRFSKVDMTAVHDEQYVFLTDAALEDRVMLRRRYNRAPALKSHEAILSRMDLKYDPVQGRWDLQYTFRDAYQEDGVFVLDSQIFGVLDQSEL